MLSQRSEIKEMIAYLFRGVLLAQSQPLIEGQLQNNATKLTCFARGFVASYLAMLETNM